MLVVVIAVVVVVVEICVVVICVVMLYIRLWPELKDDTQKYTGCLEASSNKGSSSMS